MPITAQAAGEKAGSIKAWPSTIVPAGWIKANGAAVSRTLYAALFGVIGTTYGVGDGSTTFNLPDFRGGFIRGLDDGRGIDTSRALGTEQAESIASHSHSSYYISSFSGNGYQAPFGVNGSFTWPNGAASYLASTTTAGGTETRPRNQAALMIIKY